MIRSPFMRRLRQPMLHSSSREITCVPSVERITAHTSANGANLRISGDESGFSWFANYARFRLFIIDIRYSGKTQNPTARIQL
jgi:hypothetical protein